jgi:hypothetical protein
MSVQHKSGKGSMHIIYLPNSTMYLFIVKYICLIVQYICEIVK